MHTNRSTDCVTHFRDALNEYKTRGYHFCLVSDHECYWDSKEMDTENFCVLSGVEIAINRNPKRSYILDECLAIRMHFNLIKDVTALASEPSFTHGQILQRPVDFGLDSWNECVDLYRKKGHLVMLNHPNWSRLSPEMMLGIQGCFAFEIFNTSSILEVGCNSDDEIWDYCLARGKHIYAAAGDDTHLYGQSGACCGVAFNNVSAQKLCETELVAALKNGNFYPSTGPTIHDMRVSDGVLRMRFSPAQTVRVIGAPGFGKGKTVRPGQALTEFSWKVNETLKYFRVCVLDGQGGKAWSQPVFLETLMNEARWVNAR